MTTLRLDLAYDGSGFRGYAFQEGLRTVQGDLEAALKTVLGHPVETAVAGRTDAGVHAVGQVMSLHVDEAPDLEKLARSLNGIVGPEIAVTALSSVRRRLSRPLLCPVASLSIHDVDRDCSRPAGPRIRMARRLPPPC